jgi:acetyl esterase/lipase
MPQPIPIPTTISPEAQAVLAAAAGTAAMPDPAPDDEAGWQMLGAIAAGDDPAFPPMILTAGTRDFLLSDTVRMHRKLLASGVHAELHVWEGAPHGLFMGRAPEDREQVAQVRAFLEAAWEAAGWRRG